MSTNTTIEKIKKQVADNPVIIYMKGVPEAPECGFSAKAIACLKATGVEFAYVNVLKSPFIMERLPEYSRFPTFPQVFINQELIGGSDVCEELLASGELVALMKTATAGA